MENSGKQQTIEIIQKIMIPDLKSKFKT